MEKIKSDLQHELNNSIKINNESIEKIVKNFNEISAENIIDTAEVLLHFKHLNKTYSSILNKLIQSDDLQP